MSRLLQTPDRSAAVPEHAVAAGCLHIRNVLDVERMRCTQAALHRTVKVISVREASMRESSTRTLTLRSLHRWQPVLAFFCPVRTMLKQS